MLELARAHGWKLALMRFPTPPRLLGRAARGLAARAVGAAGAARAGLSRCLRVWDFGKLEGLSDADYRNGDHINDGASARVTALFDHSLSAWLGEPVASGPAAVPEGAASAEP
jgi:hypothetical protein